MIPLDQATHVRSRLDDLRTEAERERLAAACRAAREGRAARTGQAMPPSLGSRVLASVALLLGLVEARP
jgi:hypothetical protein